MSEILNKMDRLAAEKQQAETEHQSERMMDEGCPKDTQASVEQESVDVKIKRFRQHGFCLCSNPQNCSQEREAFCTSTLVQCIKDYQKTGQIQLVKSEGSCAYFHRLVEDTVRAFDSVETFSTGAVRDKTDYRYDLMSPTVAIHLLPKTCPARALVHCLLTSNVSAVLVVHLMDALQLIESTELIHLYAQALHEGASKYGERNWEKGIPESNLINHALFHLFQLVAGDESENHKSHLVWNVLTLIHFRLAIGEKGTET